MSWFRWRDALLPGLPAVLTLVIALYMATLSPYHYPIQAHLITWLVAAGFTWFYIVIARWRWQVVKSIEYVTKQGVAVVFSGTAIKLTQEAVEEEIERVIALWFPHYLKARAALQGVVLVFKPQPFEFEYRGQKGKFSGLAWPWYKRLMVGLNPVLRESALGHELGHVLLYSWKGDASEAGLKAMADESGIPY